MAAKPGKHLVSDGSAAPDPAPDPDYDIAEPRAPAMIESLRAFGYSLPAAIADLVDNSISAGARNVWITLHWNGADSHISVRDDGRGMTEPELVEAMRPGTKSPLEERPPSDLGRFGLGLKTASFSQCRRLTVASRAGGDPVAIRRWDLDYVRTTKEWRLLRSAAAGSEHRLAGLADVPSGTVVLWECMDRLVASATPGDQYAHDRFLIAADEVKQHLAAVFHRFLEGVKRLQLWINERPVVPWDPFLRSAPATQALPTETVQVRRHPVVIRPYILPHHSKIDPALHAAAAGQSGWNAHQGFYVYRNERLLVPGDWLGLFAKEEHHKLARIQVDLSNTLDSEWQIDVKKSRARPPDVLRSDLLRIAKLTRERAVEVYRHRGKVLARESAASHVFVWMRKVRHGKIFYRVNRDHPLVAQALNGFREHTDAVRTLLRLLEETVPVPLIVLDSAQKPDALAIPFEHAPADDVLEVIRKVHRALLTSSSTLTPIEALNRLATMEPFQHYLSLIAVLREEIEQGAPE